MTIYVNKDLLIHNVRPVSLLMHLTPDDTQKDLLYWNELRQILPNVVDIKYYTSISQIARGVVVIPHGLKEYRQRNMLHVIKKEIAEARKVNLEIVVFNQSAINYSFKGVMAEFQTNATQSADVGRKKFVVPNWLYDLGYHPLDTITDVPTVNFTAHVSYPGKINNIIKFVPFPKSLTNYLASSYSVDTLIKNLSVKQVIARKVRLKLVKSLNLFRQVQLTLKIRHEPFFGLPTEKKKVLQFQYRQNIAKNLYTIIIRGDGQGVFQLFEVMSAGRIPIIIDTNMALPELSSCQWDDFALLVPFSKVDKLENYILEFHQHYTKEDLLQKCALARQACEELLPHNFVLNKVIPTIIKLSNYYK